MTPSIPPSPSSHHPAGHQTRAAGRVDRMPLVFCDLDEFEEGLLPVLRHFMQSLVRPESQSWQFAFRVAAERWGESLGLPVAQSLFKLVQFTTKARRVGFDSIDPLSLEDREYVTRDEQAFLQMLHHMRRDETSRAREAVANVTGCSMDPDVIRAGLSFADRFPAGTTRSKRASSLPSLRVVG